MEKINYKNATLSSRGLFIGLAGVDLVYYLDNLPLENNKIKTTDYEMHIGGPAANAAITYAILGGKAKLVTSIGDSKLGETVKNELTDTYGIKVTDISKGKSILLSTSSIAISDNGSRTIWSGQQKIEDVIEINQEEILKDVRFILSDCNIAGINLKVLEYGHRHEMPIVLDLGSWKTEVPDYLYYATDIIASSQCIIPSDLGTLEDLYKTCPDKAFAVTNGEEGIKWLKNGDTGTVYPSKVKVIDTLGAGDIFHGAYCYFKYYKEMTFKESLFYAADVATNSIQFKGPRLGVEKYMNVRK
jgi:sugar/nucleoside kinase (ribokinase family)